MNDICKSCGAELPPTPCGEKRRPCPNCGETARVIQANVHAMAGAASCEAKGIVIRPDPAVLELTVPDVEVVVAEPPDDAASRGRSIVGRRMLAYLVLREDARLAAADGGPNFDEMLWRVHALLTAMEREAANGDYDG
jgi:predicted RNA-binding Zn-ribbon protein involved in translation (DUF1610 family)